MIMISFNYRLMEIRHFTYYFAVHGCMDIIYVDTLHKNIFISNICWVLQFILDKVSTQGSFTVCVVLELLDALEDLHQQMKFYIYNILKAQSSLVFGWDIQYLQVKGQRGRRTLQEDHLSYAKRTPTQWHELKRGHTSSTNQLADRPQHDTHTNPSKLDGSNVCVIPADTVSSCWNLNMKHRLLLIKYEHWITEHVKSMSVST